MKEGSSADEPTNINLTDYSSDEGDTSDSSSEDDKLRINETINHVDSEVGDLQSQYLAVPPPSPLLPRSRATNRLKEKRKKVRIDETRIARRKYLVNRRAVMDLPATDPGSDLCDFSDSGDENYQNSNRKEYAEVCKMNLPDKEHDLKSNFVNDIQPLPILLRPHSLSFVDESMNYKTPRKTITRSRCIQPSRLIRNLSPILPRSQDVQIKLTSLRQQIWQGVSSNDQKNGNLESSFVKSPLSWGVSSLALAYHTGSEALLKSCSKKLEALDYVGKTESRKSKKSSVVKKSVKTSTSVPSEDTPEDESQQQQQQQQKPMKKKRSRLKRQKAINVNFSNNEEACISRPVDRTNSLKLYGVAKVPKPQQKQKSETKKKFRRGSLAVAAAAQITQTKNKKNPPEIFSEGSSSDDPLAVNKNRTNKKKNKSGSIKKRASSANVLLRNVKNDVVL